MTELAVELRDVFCVHRTSEGDAAALQGLNLEVPCGETLCVLGPSGAGKSTLLRVIAGLQEPSAGVVSVLGVDLRRLGRAARARLRHRQLGVMGQSAEAALHPDLSAAAAVELPLALRGEPAPARRARVAELLDAAALSDQRGLLPSQLSGGERQRLALCVAIAHRPALLLADEPTGELDEPNAQRLLTLMADLAREHGTSVIIASHDLQTAAMAERIVRIRDGRVVEERGRGGGGLVIGRGGWLQLPPEMLAEAGIGRRAHVRTGREGLILTPDPSDGGLNSIAPASAEPPVSASGNRRWRPALAELRDVARSYRQGAERRRVLDGLSHAFSPGRLTVITGRSGSGKTTLVSILAALERPSAGEVTIDERQLGGLDREQLALLRRERIGFMSQDPRPIGFLSAEENLVLSLRVRGWSQGAALARARAVLALTGLADRARQRVSRLSAGEIQRVALARALASARGLLIVDEPTSRLDEANASAIGELFVQATVRDNQTVICATHDPVLIAHADDQLALA
jgi:ABC-type lipoprotein export system ATPase subunit